MLIHLVPVRMDAPLEARLDREVLVLNGRKVDLSGVPEGASVAAGGFGCRYLVGEIAREGGEIVLSLLLPHAADAPEKTRFPAPLWRKRPGVLPLPPFGLATTGPPAPS
ncbi:MAG: hypothetical protein IPF96_19660 [Rhodobacter sp.]|nr:hypothetical protein [Rhodobacter sp.]